MAETFVVAFVPGVTPGKWERIWRDRMPRQHLDLRPMPQEQALAALSDGAVHMAFVRDTPASDELHVIPLYREQPVVVAARDTVVAAFDSLTLADLSGENVLAAQDADAVELIATGAAVAVMPQSVARALSRKDVVARPVTDAPDTGIGLAWPAASRHPFNDVFVGIVRGRTENSTRT